MELMWSPAWVYVPGGNESPAIGELSAGPDLRYELDGLDEASVRILDEWSNGCKIPLSADLNAPGEELKVLLTGLGVLTLKIAEPLRILIAGTPPDTLISALGRQLSITTPNEQQEESVSDAVELVFRTEKEWPNPGPGIHLGIDLTHHHTLVLGPLVVPSSSSCLQCLDRLTRRRWGSDFIPPEPHMQRWSNIIAELITIQLEAIKRGSPTLVNSTMSWNVAEGRVDREPLLRAPSCGGPCRSPLTSRMPLPWEFQ